jgi:hypothetical protein
MKPVGTEEIPESRLDGRVGSDRCGMLGDHFSHWRVVMIGLSIQDNCRQVGLSSFAEPACHRHTQGTDNISGFDHSDAVWKHSSTIERAF